MRFRFWKKKTRYERPDQIPCPHCGKDVLADAIACKQCGYDWNAEIPDDHEYDHHGGDEDFDYDEFVTREFGNPRTSTRLPLWQKGIVILMIVAFTASLLGPLWL